LSSLSSCLYRDVLTIDKKRIKIIVRFAINRDQKLKINIFLTIPKEMNDINFDEKHISVLLDELVDSIKIFENKKNIIVDCTLGMWWHAIKIIEKMNQGDTFIWFDADTRNLKLARVRLEQANSDNKVEIILIHSNFVNLQEELDKVWIQKITWIYYDLWLSSLHVDEADRWFSFKLDGPLDMRFDTESSHPASFIVNKYTKDNLIKIFKEYGEEPMSKKIAEFIAKRRKIQKFETTKDLADLIGEASGNPKSKNRIFQALRIETNHELDYAKKSIEDAIQLLEVWWHIFVISFHSLEDRITKQTFKKETRDCICSDIICTCHHVKSLKLLNKKPILPTEEEIKRNPRSRSAKARWAEKI